MTHYTEKLFLDSSLFLFRFEVRFDEVVFVGLEKGGEREKERRGGTVWSTRETIFASVKLTTN